MRTFIRLLLCTFAAAFLTTACSGTPDTPEGVAKAFFEQIMIKGDIDAVMKLLELPDKNDSKNAGLEDMVRGKMSAGIEQEKKRSEENGGVNNITVDKVDIDRKDPTFARVYVVIHYKNGKQRQDNVRVVKTDKGWKIRV